MKKKISLKSLPPWLQIALPAALVLILLAVILLVGSLTPQTPPEDPTHQPLASSPYRPGDFVMMDGFMTSTAVKAVTGIDVSEFQTDIDWPTVREAGMRFVMIRSGFRGTTEGRLHEDASFSQHLKGAQEAGLDVGVYFFSQAISPEEAREEARFVLKQLGDTKLEMPVVFDWEYIDETARTAAVDSRTLTDSAIAFCETIREGGYTPMVYFNPDLAQRLFLLEELQDYGFWLAMYDHPMDFPWKVDMWQYTDSGTVPGIDTPVDLNLLFPES